jgi:hypothetical protein
MGSDLVNLATTDVHVIDSKSLIDVLIDTSFDRIEKKNGERARAKQLEKDQEVLREQHKAIRRKYYLKAEAAYEKIWRKCEKTSPGHNWNNQDLKGTTVSVCTVCGLHFQNWKGDHSKDRNKVAISMNSELIKMLQAAMIEKDEESGDLIWPV